MPKSVPFDKEQNTLAIKPFKGASDKQRLLACLRGEKTDRVPHLELLIEDYHVEKLLGRKAGNTLGYGGDPAKGSKEGEKSRPMLAKDWIEICQMTGQDVIFLEAIWTPIKQKNPDGTIGLLNDKSFKSKKDLNRVIWPDESDMEERLQYVREYVDAVKGTNIGVVFYPPCIWQTIYEFVVGLHDCLIMMMEEAETIGELLARSADYGAELTKKAIDAGIDALWFGDDFAYNKGMFVEPKIFEEVWRPHFDRMMEPARQANVPIIFHSDGKIDDAMEMLLDMGVDAINPMDTSGIDYRDYKKRYGHRVTLMGNIDITHVLVSGTPDDVDRDVKQHADVLKPGGRWIGMSSHSIVNYIPHENFIAMINAFHKYGVY